MSLSDRLLTVKELGEHLRCSDREVYRLAERGDIPHLRVGRMLRFRLDEVLAALRQEAASSNGNGRPEARPA